MNEVSAYLKTKGKIAICQTNGKATTASILNQILLSNDSSYISNISLDGKKYPPLTSIVLSLSTIIEFIVEELSLE